MKGMFRVLINRYAILGISFVGFSFILGLILQNGLIIFLSWNMVLTLVCYGFSVMTVELKTRNNNKYLILLSGLLWLLFFPNSIYILTDFIHLQHYTFFNSYPNIYQLDLYDWFVFLDIVLAALISIKLGVMSIEHIEKIIPIKLKRFHIVFLAILFVLSSIGIYLGRFIRLNSWDIFDLSTIYQGIINQFGFFIGFIGIFTIIHSIVYILFKNKSEPFRKTHFLNYDIK